VEVRDQRGRIYARDRGANLDPFFTTKASRKGPASDFSVSYGIVEEHGGAIEVESNPGEGPFSGSSFPPSGKAVECLINRLCRGRGGLGAPYRGRILVIDDEADIRESLQTLLDSNAYSVHLADCATEGLRKIEAASTISDSARPDDARPFGARSCWATFARATSKRRSSSLRHTARSR